ncbi:MAG: DUF3466 family protein [Planctomycetes bacterium]|nr:DUF3466 family protein [Planctomycetota bacterium]
MKKLIVFASLIVSLMFSSTQAEIRYEISDLDTLEAVESAAYSVNDSGQVAGYIRTTSGAYHAFLYNGTEMLDLDTLGGTSSKAWSINNSGHVAGESQTASGTIHAFLYDGEQMTDLDTLGGTTSKANGVNSSGHVVGESNTTGNLSYHAFLYDGTEMSDPGTLGGTTSRAYGINDSNEFVGYSNTATDTYHAFLYDGTDMINLGTLGAAPSYAFGINNNQKVVGHSRTADGSYRAFLYDGTKMIDLSTLGGTRSYAYSINDSDQVVGWSNNAEGAYHAFLYNSTEGMLDLNDMIDPNSGWQLVRAYDINSSDQIVGYGLFGGKYHAYMLTPRASIPIADAGNDLNLSADGQCGATVTLDGTASSDPEGGELTYRWYYDEELLGESSQLEVELGLGVYAFTLIVNNSQKDSLPDEVVITVIDNTPPQVSVTMEPGVLWPNDKKMVKVTPTFTAVDNCSEQLTVELIEVTCNQESNGDIEITDEGIFLRAERSAKGRGKEKEDRVYTITYKVTDQSGNETITSAEVKVPQKNKKTK